MGRMEKQRSATKTHFQPGLRLLEEHPVPASLSAPSIHLSTNCTR
jgi:hypothetical protein